MNRYARIRLPKEKEINNDWPSSSYNTFENPSIVNKNKSLAQQKLVGHRSQLNRSNNYQVQWKT